MTVFLEVIATMPGSPRMETLTALLDWWGTFGPEPGFASYRDPLSRPRRSPTGASDGSAMQHRCGTGSLKNRPDCATNLC